ncbi:putative aldehyde dehydrogenase [Trypanosoma theileri]|uniref:Putative aldehyde dehydrogenase n=1 Tax=Trypanosoma theileri TaxID=67003 RepID=A0A1X0P7T9_9TRYP|nr:putative aldehyde dehydrogenase [Trypanosoma theileri]ORC93006.1 putative aldehyde dehydrogenase [Trypanosoma theileri]
MRRTNYWFCKTVFDFSNPSKFITERIVDKPVNFINGVFLTPAGSPVITVEDPCTHNIIGEIPNCGSSQTLEAINVAESAFKKWKNVMPRERAFILHKWADLILHHKESLANILSRESGKVVSEGMGECLYAERFIEWYAGEAERVYGDIIPGPRKDVLTMVLRQPVGVVAVITPWNFPSAMITRAVAGAIAAGCTVVLKPSELTPFSALALAQLATEAGVPEGVFNIITGDAPPIGETLLDSFNVRKISFTGSTRVGKYLYKRSASTMKKLSLELGGNAPFIIFEDADLEKALNGLINAKFRSAGQACISSNRIFVHTSIYDTFLKMLIEKVKTLRVGNSFDKSVNIGALINNNAIKRLETMVEDAVLKGAKVEIGGKRINGPGYFFEPTILSCVDHDSMKCCQEEIFGPLIPILKFTDTTEVIEAANSTPAGLAAYIYTQDYRKQLNVSEQLQFGMIGVNDSGLSSPCAPFGGIKESGLGRDGSKYGIDAFVDIKYVLQSRE